MKGVNVADLELGGVGISAVDVAKENERKRKLDEQREELIKTYAPIGETTAPFQRDNLDIAFLPPIPMQITQWRVAILVLRPPTRTASGLQLVKETTDTEVLMSSVGVLVSKGKNAFKSKTRAGIKFADEPHNPDLGDYVIFAQHAGILITMRGQDPQTGDDKDIEFRIMNDSDILGVTKTPFAFRFYL
jgi:hypothetical protein